MIRALLLDIDGVLWWQNQLLPGAAETLQWLQQQSLPFVLVTNRVSLNADQLCRQLLDAGLADAGVNLTPAHILTPACIAQTWLAQSQVQRWLTVLPESLQSQFQRWSASDTEAGGLLLADVGAAWDATLLNRCLRFLLANPEAPFLALGMTRYFIGPHGPELDIGAWVKALEYASGREALVMGKPSPACFQAALQRLGCAAGEALMVGDDLITDVLAARAAGLTAVLVQTGKYRPADALRLAAETGDGWLLPGISELPHRWQWLAGDSD